MFSSTHLNTTKSHFYPPSATPTKNTYPTSFVTDTNTAPRFTLSGSLPSRATESPQKAAAPRTLTHNCPNPAAAGPRTPDPRGSPAAPRRARHGLPHLTPRSPRAVPVPPPGRGGGAAAPGPSREPPSVGVSAASAAPYPCPGRGETGAAAGRAGLGTRCTSPSPAEPLTQTNKMAAAALPAAQTRRSNRQDVYC